MLKLYDRIIFYDYKEIYEELKPYIYEQKIKIEKSGNSPNPKYLTIDISNGNKIMEIDFDFSMEYFLYNYFYVEKVNDIVISNYSINIDRVIFNKKVDFRYINFKNAISIENVEFKSFVYFNNLKFKYLYINKCLSETEWKFYNIEICQELKLHLKPEETPLTIVLDNIKFKNEFSNLYINLYHYEIDTLKITNTTINGRIDLQNIKVNEVDFQGSIINGGLINPINFKVHKFANRESALFLKQQAYARNNAIDALEYKAKEIEKHKEDLIKDWQKNKDFKTFGDIVSIGLSSLYSDNGQNWIRAFICTILFPTVFFTLSFAPYTITLFILIILCFAYPIFYNNNITKYIFCSLIAYLIISFLYMFNDNSHLNFIKELFSFLTPTNFNQIVYNNENPSYIHSNNTSYIQLIFKGISYFIGKIAFWYGSVQTVTAFRKFAKGA